MTGIYLIFQEDQMSTTQDPQIWKIGCVFNFWAEKNHAKEEVMILYPGNMRKHLNEYWTLQTIYKYHMQGVYNDEGWWRRLKMVALSTSLLRFLLVSVPWMFFPKDVLLMVQTSTWDDTRLIYLKSWEKLGRTQLVQDCALPVSKQTTGDSWIKSYIHQTALSLNSGRCQWRNIWSWEFCVDRSFEWKTRNSLIQPGNWGYNPYKWSYGLRLYNWSGPTLSQCIRISLPKFSDRT